MQKVRHCFLCMLYSSLDNEDFCIEMQLVFKQLNSRDTVELLETLEGTITSYSICSLDLASSRSLLKRNNNVGDFATDLIVFRRS